MFWFAGLVGMGIESRRVRRWLSAPSTALYASLNSRTTDTSNAPGSSAPPPAPASYSASFNPFPALVIGVTGAAMAAHAQQYVFQVQIHSLWGGLLAAFAVLRCLTYFFAWLGPPRSVLPGRPPTEALAGFFLAGGGLMFQLSTEELTLAAMRRGHDGMSFTPCLYAISWSCGLTNPLSFFHFVPDQMMFLNVAVAFTCFAFCWTLGIVAFKGWLKSRSLPAFGSEGSRTRNGILNARNVFNEPVPA